MHIHIEKFAFRVGNYVTKQVEERKRGLSVKSDLQDIIQKRAGEIIEARNESIKDFQQLLKRRFVTIILTMLFNRFSSYLCVCFKSRHINIQRKFLLLNLDMSLIRKIQQIKTQENK